jgi:hypothetical protein
VSKFDSRIEEVEERFNLLEGIEDPTEEDTLALLQLLKDSLKLSGDMITNIFKIGGKE